MNKFKSKVRGYYELNPTRYPVVASIAITQGLAFEGACEQTVSMVLEHQLGDPGAKLHLHFHGVRDLVVQQPASSLISIGHVEILCGAEFPGIQSNYLVRDPEQERVLWFECRDFDAYVE